MRIEDNRYKSINSKFQKQNKTTKHIAVSDKYKVIVNKSLLHN